MNVSPSFGGAIIVDGIMVPSYPHTYTYEENKTVLLEAVPDPGFQFVSWSGCVNSTENPMTLIVEGLNSLVAHFSSDSLGVIGGFVWEDDDEDGLQGYNEFGSDDITVELYQSDGTFMGSVTTNNGNYRFIGLEPGEYFVFIDAPSPLIFSPKDQGELDSIDSDANANGRTDIVSISGDQVITLDAGVYAHVSSHSDLTPEGIKSLIDENLNIVILDIREENEFCEPAGHIPNSHNYPWNSGAFEEMISALPKNSEIILVCRSGHRSNHAAEFLDSRGYTSVTNMTGGMDQWEWGTVNCHDLVVDFGIQGLWKYHKKEWSLLIEEDVQYLYAKNENLYVDGGPLGLWQLVDPDWKRLTALDADNINNTMIVLDKDLFVDFGTNGFWTYSDNQWVQVARKDIEFLYTYQDKLYVDGGTLGLWQFDGINWTRLTTLDADNTGNTMVASDTGLFVDFGTSGLMQYIDNKWTVLTSIDVEYLYTYHAKLLVDAGAKGLWQFDGVNPTRLTFRDADNTGNPIIAYGNSLAVDFGNQGLWKYDGILWTQLNDLDVEYLSVLEEKLIVDAGILGLWQYDDILWKKIRDDNADNNGNTMVEQP